MAHATLSKKHPHKQVRPERRNAPSEALPYLDGTELLLNGSQLDEKLAASILPASSIDRTIEGASTVTLVVDDPDRRLVQSKIVESRASMLVPCDLTPTGVLAFSLAHVSKAGNQFTCIFEDQDVALLRGHKGPLKAARGRVTRAMFIERMVREEPEIGFYSPGVTPIGAGRVGAIDLGTDITGGKPTARPKVARARQQTVVQKQPGFAPGAHLTVKGSPASPKQAQNMAIMLGVATSLHVTERVMVALMEIGIVEDEFNNSPCTNDGTGHYSIGVIQAGGGTSPSSCPSYGQDVAKTTELCLTGKASWSGAGGLINACRNTSRSTGACAQAEQGSAFPGRYDAVEGEAKRIIAAYNGGTGAVATSATAGASPGVYEFTRGLPNQPEDTWTCTARLASEVAWRRFMVAGVFYYINDTDLLRSQPLMTIREFEAGVETIDGEWDTGKPVETCTVICDAAAWFCPPGSVVVVEDQGPWNDRWIVQQIQRPWGSVRTSITLTRPQQPKPEPPAPTSGSRTGGGGVTGAGQTVAGSKARIVSPSQAIAPANAPPAVAAFIAAGNRIATHPYHYGGGHGSSLDHISPDDYDCSSSTCYALHAAGLFGSSAVVSGDLETFGEAGPGQWITIYANGGHVWSVVAGIEWNTAGHSSISGPRWQPDGTYQKSGFTVRHPRGL